MELGLNEASVLRTSFSTKVGEGREDGVEDELGVVVMSWGIFSTRLGFMRGCCRCCNWCF